MPTLSQLGQVLTSCRVATAEQWQKAARRGAGSLADTLDALAAEPAWWSADESDPAPGLTDYQRGVIELWFEGGPPPHHQLALNRFLLLDKLGQGGQGEVYRARQLNPARIVAVKTLTQDTETGRRRFEQEARALMRVQHPGIAGFYLYERVRDDEGNPTDDYLIAMEFVEGTDLHRMVQDIGAVPWPFVVRWAVDLLGGLAAIHKNGFIHRDVKPANAMVLGPTPEPEASPIASAAKLLDFGAVKLTDATSGSGSRHLFVGTREYAPPEQWSERVVPASDLYALGGTLFYALTGRPPFEVEGRDAVAFMKAHARAPIPDIREFAPEVPEELDRLIRQMLAKKPSDRGTAGELLAEFRALLPPEMSREEPPVPPPSRALKPTSRPHPAPPPAPEDSEGRGVVGSLLAAVERACLPPQLRPRAGHEPPTAERIAALLRRPLVLVVLLILLALLIFWVA